MFVCESWREETSSLPFLISLKWAGNTLPGSWVCSVFSPKKTVIKILGFLFPVWICVHSAVGCCLQRCSSLSPCLAACTGLTFDPTEFLFQQLLFLRGLHFPCWDLSLKSLVCSGLMTSLLCSYFPCMLVDPAVSQLCFYLLFIFCLCTAEPRTQLCFTGLGTGSRAWSPENWGGAEQLQSGPALGWHSQGVGSAGISYSTLPV